LYDQPFLRRLVKFVLSFVQSTNFTALTCVKMKLDSRILKVNVDRHTKCRGAHPTRVDCMR